MIMCHVSCGMQILINLKTKKMKEICERHQFRNTNLSAFKRLSLYPGFCLFLFSIFFCGFKKRNVKKFSNQDTKKKAKKQKHKNTKYDCKQQKRQKTYTKNTVVIIITM